MLNHSFWVGQDLDYWEQRLWSIVAFRSRLWTEIQGHSYYHHNHCYQGSFRSQTQILLGMRKISFGIWPDLRVADSTRTTTSPHICHFYQTQVNLGSDSWARLSLNPRRCWDFTDWLWLMKIPTQYLLIMPRGQFKAMRQCKCGGQICNLCKWRHLMAKFATIADGAIWWPNL